ncbi:MAG: metallophosphoesterase family protein [Thermodesulfobacteriota bacterium]
MKIGILSDTHLSGPSERFQELTALCFSDCPVILHAGDLTDISVLSAFGQQRTVHAVHGNMCLPSSVSALPREIVVTIDSFTFGLSHGREYRHKVEENLINHFPQVDCIVSGHTHQPLVKKMFATLFVNPGSFTGTGPYGAPGTFAIIDTNGGTLSAKIFEVPRL